jgi:hypothetical protein
MQLTPGTTIERGDTVTRQTIYDLVNNAIGGTVQESDLAEYVLQAVPQSEPPTPYPGRLWFDQTEQLMKVYTDVMDDTAVSVWLSLGPDRFDVALIAAEPIPYGAAIQLVGDGRWAKLPPDPLSLEAMGKGFYEWEVARVIGFNNNGTMLAAETVDSGAWFSCAVDGFVRTWHPVNKNGFSSFGGLTGGQDSLIIGITQLTGPSGISEIRGAVARDEYQGEIQVNRSAYLLPSWQKIAVDSSTPHEFFYPLQQFNGPHIAKHA